MGVENGLWRLKLSLSMNMWTSLLDPSNHLWQGEKVQINGVRDKMKKIKKSTMLTRYDGEPHKFFTNILHKLCSPYQQTRFLYASHIIFSTLMAAFYIMDEPKHIRVYLAKKNRGAIAN